MIVFHLCPSLQMALGAAGHDVNGSNSGRVRVFKLDGSSWIQFGQGIDGLAFGDNSAIAALSADGTVVAIGGPLTGNSHLVGTFRGKVRVTCVFSLIV